jgi:DNA-binding MarR family transcriptional regulator
VSRVPRVSARARALGPELGRELSTWTILFHQAVAERLGLNVTDHKCLGLLDREGPVTAGRLAAVSGLTTGAITGVVDRLERAGFVRREEDPRDRRRVLIRPVPGAERRIAPLFASLRKAMERVCARFSDPQLALIGGYMELCIAALREETQKLRAGRTAGRAARRAAGRAARRVRVASRHSA